MKYKCNTKSCARDNRALERELTALACQLNTENHRLLILLAEFDSRRGYVEFGLRSCAHWLSWRCGIGLVSAREKVRVARALQKLPLVSESMRRGILSYCKVRALTRVATQDCEASLVAFAESCTVSDVERIVRMMRVGDPAEELARANARRAFGKLKAVVTRDGCIVVKGKLSADEGACLLEALQVAADELETAERESARASESEPADIPLGARFADALLLIAERYLAGGGAPLRVAERHLVHLRVDERVLGESSSGSAISPDARPPVAPATVKRWCCDGSLIAVVEGSGGKSLRIGRRTRVVPAALRRALEVRDGGCRYPRCTSALFLEAHHIVHWADGGETALDNMILLCRRHHLFVHEHGYRVDPSDDGLRFERPDGTAISEDPSPTPPDPSSVCA